MKKTGPADLTPIRDLIAELKALPGVVEQIPGVYHHGGSALVDFHADTGGLTADFREAGEWKRLPVTTPEEQAEFLARLRASLPTAKVSGPRPPGHGREIRHGMKLEPRARPARAVTSRVAQRALRAPRRTP